MPKPTSLDEVASVIRTSIAEAEEKATESSRISHNSYGAGYDTGVLITLRDLLHYVTVGEPR